MGEYEIKLHIHLLNNRPRVAKECCVGKKSYQKNLIDFLKKLLYNIYNKKKEIKTLVQQNITYTDEQY